MPFHLGWLGPAEGCGYRGFYVGDDRYRHVGHQQDRGAPGQENRTVQNAKPDHPVSQGAAVVPSHRHEQYALKDGPSADQPESSRGRTGLRSESSVVDKAKPDTEKSPEEVAAEQNRVLEVKAETRIGAGTSLQRPPNQSVRFPKSDHPVSSASR
jgi:hypothetical protein